MDPMGYQATRIRPFPTDDCANGIQGTLSCAGGGCSAGGASAASGGVCPPGEASCAKVSNEKTTPTGWLLY